VQGSSTVVGAHDAERRHFAHRLRCGHGADREPQAAMTLPRHIVVATDFSDTAARALDFAVELAAKLDARVHLLHVLGITELGVPELGVALTSTMMQSIVASGEKQLDREVAARPGAKIETLLRSGDVRAEILHTAAQVGAELVVLGTHGRRGVGRAVLGSVAEHVLRHARCPVLIIRRQAR
jgi:nucleotide-binding universal stress UspA family protein